jgi:hypothetical protein
MVEIPASQGQILTQALVQTWAADHFLLNGVVLKKGSIVFWAMFKSVISFVLHILEYFPRMNNQTVFPQRRHLFVSFITPMTGYLPRL